MDKRKELVRRCSILIWYGIYISAFLWSAVVLSESGTPPEWATRGILERMLISAFYAWIFGALLVSVAMLPHMLICQFAKCGDGESDEVFAFYKVVALVVWLHSFLFGYPYPVLPIF